jgi:hypothetical protein
MRAIRSISRFLLRHMPDAHLQFCLTCPHGVFLRSSTQPIEYKFLGAIFEAIPLYVQ